MEPEQDVLQLALVAANWGLSFWILGLGLAGWRRGEPRRLWLVALVLLEWLGPVFWLVADDRWRAAYDHRRLGPGDQLVAFVSMVGMDQTFGFWPLVAVPVLFLAWRRRGPSEAPMHGPLLAGALMGPALVAAFTGITALENLTGPIAPDFPQAGLAFLFVLPGSRILGFAIGVPLGYAVRYLRRRLARPPVPDGTHGAPPPGPTALGTPP